MQRFYILVILMSALVYHGCDQSGDAKLINEPSSQHNDEVERFVVMAKYADVLFEENAYLLFDQSSGDALLIDPGTQNIPMQQFINANNLHPKAILNTHGHADHVGANGYYRNKYDCDVYASSRDIGYYNQSNPANLPTVVFTSEPSLSFGTIEIQLIYVPGHTEGSTCFYTGRFLFSGDTLFKGSIGRTWPTEDMTAQEITDILVENIEEKILVLPESTRVYPGHMDTTTIGYEKRTNPYLQ